MQMLHDSGLLCSLLNIQSPRQLSSHYLRGHIFESMVISEYIKNRYNIGQCSNAYFWRDNKGHEIDLLLEHAEGLTAVEIKSTETLKPDLFRSLQYFKSLSGLPDDSFFMLYGGSRKQSRKHGQALGWQSAGDLALR